MKSPVSILLSGSHDGISLKQNFFNDKSKNLTVYEKLHFDFIVR
jgi:hypothetical protein